MFSRIEDAEIRLEIAKQRMEKADFAGVIREAQACVELSLKALLEVLGVEYRDKRGRYPHDVSDKIPEAFKKLEPLLRKEPYGTKFVAWKQRIGIVTMLSRILAAVRDQTTYGIQELGLSSKDIFLSFFGEKLAKVLLRYARQAYIDVHDMIQIAKSVHT